MISRYAIVLGAVLLAAHSSGCASSEVHSFLDPDFRGAVFHRIAVAPTFPDLKERRSAELCFVAAFEPTDAEAVPSMTIVLPTREYSDDELFANLAAHHIDAVLMITETEYLEEVQHVPQSSYIHTTGTLTARHFHETTHVTTSGGYYVYRPRIRHELNLFDVDTRRKAWTATSLTQGDSRSAFSRMIEALAEATVEQLVADGLLEPADGE